MCIPWIVTPCFWYHARSPTRSSKHVRRHALSPTRSWKHVRWHSARDPSGCIFSVGSHRHLVRIKYAFSRSALMEYSFTRFWANEPERRFARGRNVYTLFLITSCREHPIAKPPIVTSFTAVTSRLLLHLKTYLMTGSIEISSGLVRFHNDGSTDKQRHPYPCLRTDPTVWRNRQFDLHLSCFRPLEANLRQNIALRPKQRQLLAATVEVHRLSSD
jgi:hypothetical protein